MGSITLALTILEYVIPLVEAGSVAYAQIMAKRAEVEAMEREGREPTAEEWRTLFASIDTHKRRIRESAAADDDAG